MKGFARASIVPLALALLGTSSPAKLVPLGKYREGILIPTTSPVRFRRFDQYDRAHFNGTFIVEGTFVLDCNYCERGYKDNELHLSMIPDAPIAARLPHWKMHNGDIEIDITGATTFIRSITTPQERQMLLSLKLNEIKGRAALVVDQFEAGLDCDSANYSARFVAIAKPAKRNNRQPGGDVGC